MSIRIILGIKTISCCLVQSFSQNREIISLYSRNLVHSVSVKIKHQTYCHLFILFQLKIYTKHLVISIFCFSWKCILNIMSIKKKNNIIFLSDSDMPMIPYTAMDMPLMSSLFPYASLVVHVQHKSWITSWVGGAVS